ncbi:BRO-N domain-containing protein [Pseudogulbenkiania sp. NH8B]|uniref:BRO-N domain-containing protein n=1 Tax=Pseudogulbenkiania sp. (strain NH8B) TaxID=748280 RepID=UPI0003172774|nr:BRO family protein [Pseudogulbenkiania sp. NH8B]
MNALTFDETRLEIVDHSGQPWLKAADIAQALGYKKADAVTQIYERNKDEFTEAMTETLNLRVSRNGGSLSNETRIFSLRGAHLIAMFAHTQRAKAFRQWVLDVLEQQAGASANVVPALPVAELMRRKRFLMHFDVRGEMVMREVPSEAMVASPREWAQLIADPGAFFEREELTAIITAAAQRLGRR